MGSGITKTMPSEVSINVSNVPVQVSFSSNLTWLTVSTDISLFVANNEAALTIPASGVNGQRVFIGANIYKETLPFTGDTAWLVNAVNGETSTKIKLEGRA